MRNLIRNFLLSLGLFGLLTASAYARGAESYPLDPVTLSEPAPALPVTNVFPAISGTPTTNQVSIFTNGGTTGPTIGNSNCSENGTIFSCTDTGGIQAADGPVQSDSDGTHAGLLSVGGNTTVPTSLPSNSFGFLGPNSSSFTSYFFQFPATAPAANDFIYCAAVSSNRSSCSFTAAAAGQVLNNIAFTATPALGTDNSVAGTLQLSNSAANAHTILGSAATTTNTILGFASAPTSGDLVDCVTSSTTCTLTDSSVVAANVNTNSSSFSSNILVKSSGNHTTASSSITDNGTVITTSEPIVVSATLDGEVPIAVTTGVSCTLGTASGCTTTAYSTTYAFNQEATAGTAITYTLPTAAAGKQYCVANSNNGSAADTGTLEIATSASGQYIIFTDGTLSASGGYVISGGAAADAACVVGLSSTQWQLYTQSGTWTKH